MDLKDGYAITITPILFIQGKGIFVSYQTIPLYRGLHQTKVIKIEYFCRDSYSFISTDGKTPQESTFKVLTFKMCRKRVFHEIFWSCQVVEIKYFRDQDIK